MQQQGRGFYTIGSAGHEGNAAVAAALRPTRPGAAALPVRRVLLRPRAAGGRRRPGRATCCSVWPRRPTSRSRAGGTRCSARRELAVIPRRRRSPRTCRAAVGLAFAHRPGREAGGGLPSGRADAVTVVQFGDASVNHSTAVGAINAACCTAYQGSRCRCCWSARTTGSGSACRPRAGGCGRLPRPARPASTCRGRVRPGRCLRRGRGRGRHGADEAAAGVPAPVDGPLSRPRGQRRRVGVPVAAEHAADCDRDPLVATARHAGRVRRADPRRGRGTLRRDRRPGARSGRAGAGQPAAGQRSRR